MATIPTKRREPLTSPELTELVTRARELGEARQGREAIAAADNRFNRHRQSRLNRSDTAIGVGYRSTTE